MPEPTPLKEALRECIEGFHALNAELAGLNDDLGRYLGIPPAKPKPKLKLIEGGDAEKGTDA